MGKKTDRRLKILWHANAHFVNSGYAVFTRDLLKRLQADGWEVAQVANYGIQGYHAVVDGIKIYPVMGDPFGTDALLPHGKDFGAHVVFSMIDIYALNGELLKQLTDSGIKWIPYLPVDQIPPQPGTLGNLRMAHKIITFSEFGRAQLAQEGYASKLILEGIDTDIFKPQDKLKARQEIGLPPDAFIFGMIGANKEAPPRKGYQEAMEAFAKFNQNHKDAYLYIHTQQTSPTGFPIPDYARYLSIDDRIIFLDQYKASFGSDSHHIAKEINTFDVQLHPSQTEGFGLLIVESQACGVPPIINRCTSMPELIIENETGWACEHSKPVWRVTNGFVYPADVDSLYDKMELSYKTLKGKNNIAKAARDNVLKNFDIDKKVKQDWLPYLLKLQEELLGRVE